MNALSEAKMTVSAMKGCSRRHRGAESLLAFPRGSAEGTRPGGAEWTSASPLRLQAANSCRE